MTNQTLKNRTAVITGASSGIGEAAARRLSSLGATVVLIARRKDRLDALTKTLRAEGGKAIALGLDITDAAAVKEAARVIEGEVGGVDLLLNNAGVMLPSPMSAHRTADWEQMISLNVTSAVRMVDTFVGSLISAAAKGGPADIVNVSSIAASGVFQNFAVYCATKAAVTHLSKNLRAELGPKNVRVSVVEPGLVTTELQGHVTDPGALAWLSSVKETIEWLKPEDVADAVAYLVGLPRHVNLQQITIMPTQQG